MPQPSAPQILVIALDTVLYIIMAVAVTTAETPIAEALRCVYPVRVWHVPDTFWQFEKNLSNEGSTGPHMDAFRAATYAKLGKDGEAKTIIDNLVNTYPEFLVHDWLAKWLRTPNDLTTTMDSLYHLGLSRPEES